jgi:hypothetical protein
LASKSKNAEFYFTSRALVIAVLELINSKLKQGMKIPAEMQQKYKVENDNGCSINYEQKISWMQLFIILEKEIHGLPQYNACVEAMQTDKEISKNLDTLIGTSTSRWRSTADQYIGGLLQKQVLGYFEKRQFDEKAFDDDFACLEDFFYSKTIATESISPLLNFVSESGLIQFNSNLRIRELTLTERGNLMDELSTIPFSSHTLQLGTKYIVEYDYLTKKIIGDFPIGITSELDVDVQGLINKLITALRLFKQGNVTNSFVKTQYKTDVPLGAKSYSGFSPDIRMLCGNIYELTESEIEELKKLWKRIELSKINTVALRRFNYSYSRENAEDKLIDMMISLEALFLKGEKTGTSSGIIISVACSVLNGKNQKQRKEIQKKIESAYNLRNKIVHGTEFERIKKDPKTGASHDLIQETVSNIENYLRESLRKMLD